jgi:hypothetical protein
MMDFYMNNHTEIWKWFYSLHPAFVSAYPKR